MDEEDEYGIPVAMEHETKDMASAMALAVAQEVSLEHLERERAARRNLLRQESATGQLIQQGARDVLDERARVQAQSHDVVQLLGLRKVFGKTKSAPPKVALDDLWLGVQAGECFGYLGSNGAGKSTSMKILTGQTRPSSGTATILGKSVRTQLGSARRHLGYCPQFDALYELLTVKEHLVMYAQIRGVRDVRAAVASSIDRMQLRKFANVVSKQLSGGNKRKLSAAIALLGSPQVVILDEPSSGVDPLSQNFLWEVIRDSTKRTGCSVILVSHSMPEVQALSSRIGILIDGRLRCIGTSHYLKQLYGSSVVVEVNLREDTSRMVEPTMLVDGFVYPEQLRALCELMGMPQRCDTLLPNGSSASSVVAFALNSPSIGRVSWQDFSRWWILQDNADRVRSLFEEHWQQRDDQVILKDRHGPYMVFQVANPSIRVSEMFDLLEQSKHEFGIEHYAVSNSGIDEVFNSYVEQVAEVSLD